MAFAFTVTNTHSHGDLRGVHGTFTSTDGDRDGSLTQDTHGLDYITDYDIKLDSGGLTTENPKVTIVDGTLTFIYADTKGFSGKFFVLGK